MARSTGVAATPSSARPAHRARWRVTQFLHSIGTRPDPAVDRTLRRLIDNEDQWRLLSRLTPFDRAHHLRVHALLRARGCDDPDLLLAALLHDVGKADDRGRAAALHRSARVLLRRVSPRLLDRMATPGRAGILHGLYLTCHHAALGADLARHAGASERCCVLIACHDSRPPYADPALAALVAADNAAIR
jgi:hypothetical protein